VLRIEETIAPSEGGSSLAPLLSPQDSISLLENDSNGWKSNALTILDALDQFKLLLKPFKDGEQLPLMSSAPNSLDSLRLQVSKGGTGSLEEFKIAAGFIIFAASLHLSVDETRERERLVSLFDILLL
jgi:hypothetical protein